MKRKTAFIIMICLYLVTGAAACAILFSSGLRSSIPAVSADPSAQTELPEAADPSVQTESSEATDPSAQAELPEAADSSAQTESSETANSAVQTESPDSTDSSAQAELPDSADPSAQAEQEQIAESSDSSETPSAQKAEVKYRGIADQDKGKRLFIRKSPSTEGEVLGVLWTGQSGEIIDIGDEWVLLKYGDIEGYVFKEFLIIEELPQSADPQGL